MSLLVPVHIAATNALVRYLSSQLPDCQIEPQWPDPDKKLPRLAITIIPAGPRQFLYMDQLQVVDSTPIPGSNVNQLWRFRIAEIEQPYQMDVWAQFASDRDDLVARLDQILNVGMSQLSVNIGNPSVVAADVTSVVLEMEDGWEGSNAAFYFGDTVLYDDTPDQVMRSEYRATYNATGMFNLTKSIVAPTLKTAILLLNTPPDTDNSVFRTGPVEYSINAFTGLFSMTGNNVTFTLT